MTDAQGGGVDSAAVTIYRLPKTINSAAGDLTFDELIGTGAVRKYRLALALRKITLADAFGELRHKNLLAVRDMDCLIRSWDKMKPR